MFGELTFFALASTIILFAFIGIGVLRFGLLRSYSAYAPKWSEAVPINNMNLWSIVTIVAAFLICPVMLQLGVGSMLQFLGFFTPVYLFVIALTPKFSTDKKQFIIHFIASVLCVIGGMLWLLLVMKVYRIFIGVLIFITALAVFSGTYKESFIFWLEMFMFLCVYLTILFAIF